MRANFGFGMIRELKEDNSPITDTDKAINQMVIDAVKETYPHYSVVAEEGSDERKSEYVWVCDPVDGTIPFSYGYPTFVFALALVKDGRPILGVLYDAMMDRLVFAEKDKGAFVGEKRVHVNNVSQLSSTVVITEVGKEPFGALGKMHHQLIQKGCYAKSIGSMSYAGMLVATGETVAMVGTSPYPWDGAAIKIVVEEAGGKVTDLYGKDQLYNGSIKGVIATNGIMHDQIVDLTTSLLT